MRQSVLGTDRAVYQQNIRANILLCASVLIATVIIHVICTGSRTEHNHTAMLLTNIAVDLIGGSFLIARLSMCVFPQQKLLRLYDQANQETAGQVLEVGSEFIHYMGVSCCQVRLSDRRLFLPADTLVLTMGNHYRFRLKGNLIVEVSSDE